MIKKIILFFVLTLTLCLLSPVLSGEKVAVLPELKQPGKLSIDKMQSYVTENATVYLYSLNDSTGGK
jgi:hypothetical protein